MRRWLRLAVLLSLAAPVLAQDAPPDDLDKKMQDEPKDLVPGPDKPAYDSPKPGAPGAKKERRVDPKAQALLDAYAKRLLGPRGAGITSWSAKGAFTWAKVPEPARLDLVWSAKAGLVAELTLPDALCQRFPPDQLDTMKRGVLFSFVEMTLRPLLDGAVAEASQYEVLWREDAAGPYVKLFPWAEKTHWDQVLLRFDAEGVLTSMTGTPHLAMNDPLVAFAGSKFELLPRHAKRGGQLLLEGAEAKVLGFDASIVLTHHEVPGLPPLLAGVTITGGGEAKYEVFDYVVDGKPVPATAAKKDEKPAAPGGKPPR